MAIKQIGIGFGMPEIIFIFRKNENLVVNDNVNTIQLIIEIDNDETVRASITSKSDLKALRDTIDEVLGQL
jgi:hypothetical protein